MVLDTVIFNHKIGIAWFSIGNNILIRSYICDGDTTRMLNALVDDSSQVRACEGVPKASPPHVMEVSPWHVVTTNCMNFQHDHLLIGHASFLMSLWYIMSMDFSS
jgi:hypothetical protein